MRVTTSEAHYRYENLRMLSSFLLLLVLVAIGKLSVNT